MGYDLSALNDKEFEELVRDLLSKDLKLKLRSFKRGKDGGIDLRYSTSTRINEIIVQAKHFLDSGIKGLIKALKNEKEKLDKLNVGKYYIATSVKLLPQYESQIIDALNPYLTNANSIYGHERISQLLSEHSDIESKYYKLWLTSTNVLSRLLNNAVKGRSEFYAEKIIGNVKKYVATKSLSKAVKILKKQKCLMITGQPGVGKTTLAHMIIYSFLAKGYELVFIDKELRDAEEVISQNPKQKQIFYFDDFLGKTYLEVINPKTSDTSIVNFLERIQKSKNKYIILSTRTTILNSAFQIYERLGSANVELFRKELELKEYSDMDKARILYNHIYQSDLSKDELEIIFKNQNYFKIIKHRNFNPRLIEFITTSGNFIKSSKKQYFDFVMFVLNNPKEIWRHSFENQILEDDRFLLLILFSLGGSMQDNVVEYAFNKKLEFEIEHYGFTKKMDVFEKCLSRLLDGHLKRVKHDYADIFILSFVNPSIADFLANFLIQSKDARKRLILSFSYWEQLEHLFDSVLKPIYNSGITDFEKKEFLNWLGSSALGSYHNFGSASYAMTKFKGLQVLMKLISIKDLEGNADELMLSILKTIEFEKVDNYHFLEFFFPVLDNCLENGMVFNFIKSNWDIILNCVWNATSNIDRVEQIMDLFKRYEINSDKYMLETPNRSLVRRKLNEILHEKLIDEVSYQRSSIADRDSLDNLKKELKDIWENTFDLVNITPDRLDVNEYTEDIEDDIFTENEKDTIEANSAIDQLALPEFDMSSKSVKRINFDKAIHSLFER